jgi:hypothetical protein
MSSDGSSYRKIRDFYIRQYRPLYDHFVTNGELPQELHAEVAAAFDHLFRKSPDGEGSLDPKDAEKVIAHIKRATFDAFKMMFKREIREPYDRLHTLTYADVDNGKFLPDVEKAWNDAKAIAIEARNLETAAGDIDSDGWHAVFAKWNEIIPYVEKFSSWAASDKVARMRAKGKRGRFFNIMWSLVLTIFGAVLGVVLGKMF